MLVLGSLGTLGELSRIFHYFNKKRVLSLFPQPKYLIISLDGAMKKVLRSSTRGSQAQQGFWHHSSKLSKSNFQKRSSKSSCMQFVRQVLLYNPPILNTGGLFMTHAWNQSIDINEQIAKQLIESQHSLIVKTIHVMDEGWDNLVYLVNETYIFRFPRREFGLACMENEIALLSYIASQVSFPLSAPQWIGKPSDLYPYPFAGYPMISGKPVSDVAQSLIADANFAITLASWLSELHAIPVTEHYASLIKGEQGWRYDVNHRILRCKENLKDYENYFLN